MNALTFISIVLLIALVLLHQWREQEHEKEMMIGRKRLDQIEVRLSDLERSRREDFDPKAFADLSSKVDALRLAQGIRGSR